MEMKLLLQQLQVSIAVVFIFLARQGMKKMPKAYSYGLWLLVFARLLCPVALESRISFMPSLEQGSAWVEQAWENSVYREEGYGFNNHMGSWGPDIVGTGMEAGNQANPANNMMAGISYGADVPNRKTNEMDQGGTYGHIIILSIWILGVAAIIGKNGMRLGKIKKMVRGAVRLDDMQPGIYYGTYGRCINKRVYRSSKIKAPFTLGFIHPKIYLPAALEDNEREYIVCHESVHIRRKDYIAKNIAFLLLALNWFNPFIWAAFYFMERDMEMSCDEKVVKLMGSAIKRQYSQSLLDFALGKSRMAATPLTFGENHVKERVKNILMLKKAKKWNMAAGTAVLIAAGIFLFTAHAESAEESQKEPGTDRKALADLPGDGRGEQNPGKIYRSDLITLYGGEEPEEVTVQLCENGVFRLDEEGYTCLYPWPVSENAYTYSQDGILYFTLNPDGEGKSGEDTVDRICMVDVRSGEYDDEVLCIQGEPVKTADIDMLQIESGYVVIYKSGEDIYIPQVNAGGDSFYSAHRWKGKTVDELDAEEQDAYGRAVRRQLLDNPGMLLNLTNRILDETYVYIDLDGDGKTEKITLSEYPSGKSRRGKYDEYQLQAGESMLMGYSYGMDNNIWAFSIDGSRILLALCSDSGIDQETVLFSYDNRELREIGRIYYDIRYCTIENGVIESCAFLYDVLMPMDLKVRFRVNEEGMLEQEPQEDYEFYSQCNGKLLVSLPVHGSPGGKEIRYMDPQMVRLTKVDKTFQWIYLEGENGEGGWFQVDGDKGSRITELDLDSVEVFELNYAG